MDEEEIVDAGYDQSSIFNYQASETGDGIEELPVRIQLNRTKSWNQFLEKGTLKACGKYSVMHCINEEYNEENDPKPRRYQHNGTSGAVGSGIKDNLDDARDDGMIAGYVQCKSLLEVKQALNRGHCVATGTSSCDWKLVSKDHMFHYMKNGAGHLIAIEGYDDDKGWLILRDSMGQTTPKRDKGRFYIKYDDYKYLFSCYEIVDIKNKALIDKLKKMKDEELIKKVVEMGLFNGKDLEKPITRGEMGIMFGRLLVAIENLNTNK